MEVFVHECWASVRVSANEYAVFTAYVTASAVEQSY